MQFGSTLAVEEVNYHKEKSVRVSEMKGSYPHGGFIPGGEFDAK
jgi:hypothetical protein